MEACDGGLVINDGKETFDLTLNESFYEDANPGANISISYYETQENANLGDGAIDNPNAYENTEENTQEIIVRLDDDITGCYSTTTMGVIVNSLSEIEVLDYEICDYDNPGSMIEVFNLSLIHI